MGDDYFMQMSRVSVIIPFSKPDVAEIALEKLVHQTYPADLTEIVLVGPGSMLSPIAGRFRQLILILSITQVKRAILAPGLQRVIISCSSMMTVNLLLIGLNKTFGNWSSQGSVR